jgi:hypothetical protein
MPVQKLSGAFASWLERLNPRERMLLGIMAAVAVGLCCFVIVLLTNSSLAASKLEIEEQRQMLNELALSGEMIRQRLEAQQEQVKQQDVAPPALGTQLQAHATKAGMGETDLEMTPQPEELLGNWVRKSVEVRLRRKPLGQLAELWALTVNDRAQYPVAITKLHIRRLLHQEDSFDVEMTVSSYWPSEEPAPTKGAGRAKAGAKKASKGRSTGRQ